MTRARGGASSADRKTFWEQVADTRWGAYTTDVVRRAIVRSLESFRNPAHALDMGCEGGRWSRFLADRGWSTTCVDTDARALATCRRRIPGADCILVPPDNDRMPGRSSSVDLLLCIEVPPVILSDWFVAESSRVLRSGGLLIGVMWNLLSLRGLVGHVKASLTGSFDYYRISYPAWKRKLSRAGFRVLHEEGYCWFPFGRASNSVLVPLCTSLEKGLGLRRLTALSPWVIVVSQKGPPREPGVRRETGAGHPCREE